MAPERRTVLRTCVAALPAVLAGCQAGPTGILPMVVQNDSSNQQSVLVTVTDKTDGSTVTEEQLTLSAGERVKLPQQEDGTVYYTFKMNRKYEIEVELDDERFDEYTWKVNEVVYVMITDRYIHFLLRRVS